MQCKTYGGHLAALATSEELSIVETLCGEASNGCWIGGRSVNATSGHGWKWSDDTSQWNESIFSRTLLPFNCSSLSCHSNSSTDLCARINGSKSLFGDRCNTSHEFICMVEIGMALCDRQIMLI